LIRVNIELWIDPVTRRKDSEKRGAKPNGNKFSHGFMS